MMMMMMIPAPCWPRDAVGLLARGARGGDASTWARPWCVRPSRRPPRCCCCSSRACWPSASCCTGMAEWVVVEHDHQGCCLLELVPVHHEQLHHGPPGSGQFVRRARPRRRGQNAGCAAHRWYPAAQEHAACLVFGVGQLVLHVENGLIEIFLSLCGSSAPAPSCWDERRWQTSCAAAAVLLAEWRERGSCITACLHLNPSMAPTTALANSFRLREAAAVVASGGDAGDDGGDPPHGRRSDR